MYQPLPDSSNANDGSWRIRVVQQPTNAKAAQGAKEKSRSPIDPPPIVKLDTFPHLSLHDPYIMVVASSVPTGKHEGESSQQHAKNMTGSMVSSLHRLKDLQNQESGFFIFPDLLIKIPGDFKLHFALMKMKTNPSDPGDLGEWETVAETDSDPFKVYTSKDYPGMAESTVMTRSFSDQGVKVRLRKDSRKLTTAKRNHQVAQNARNT
ncbi:velvet factor, partial [Pseudomassariella vexata]